MLGLSLRGTHPKGLPLIGSSRRGDTRRIVQHLLPWIGPMVVGGGGLEEFEEDGVSVIRAQIHPAAAPIRIEAEKGETISVHAPTATVGPGYHEFLCDVFTRLGVKLNITWEVSERSDPTGFFFRQDHWNLKAAFLSALNDKVLDLLEARKHGSKYLNLFMPTRDQFLHGDAVSTPMGPRNEMWLELVSHDPASGLDAFAWLEPGLGAPYHHGRAMAMLWNHVRLRKPLTDFEVACWQDCADSFERAFAENPNLLYPWREWHRLLMNLGRPEDDPLVRHVADWAARTTAHRPLQCYRLGDYMAVFPSGWRVTLPAEIAEQYDNRTGVWMGWDGLRTIQALEMDLPKGEALTPLELVKSHPSIDPDGNGEEFLREGPDFASRANLHRATEGSRSFWRLATISANSHSQFECILNFDREHYRDWAVGAWESIDWDLSES